MIAIPAVDLREGHAVQWVGGEPDTERVRLPDPAAVAARWIDAGFTQLHIVDLDAALGTGSNRSAVEHIVSETAVPCQVGGGVRDDAAVESILAMGAARVIIGTRAVEQPAWLDAVASRFPGQLIVAADVRANTVVTRGWTQNAQLTADQLLARIADVPLAGVLVTDVTREGSETGVDVTLFERLVDRCRHPLHAAGGITTLQDLHDLRAAGVAAAVLGMALYSGKLDAETTALEFGS